MFSFWCPREVATSPVDWAAVFVRTVGRHPRHISAYLRAAYLAEMHSIADEVRFRASEMDECRAREFVYRVIRRKLNQYGAFDESFPYEGVV